MSEAYPSPPPYGGPVSSPPGRGLVGWAMGLAITAIVISLVALVVTVLSFIGFGYYDEGLEEELPPIQGTVEDLGGLREGDCFDTLLLQPESTERRDCAGVHDAELYLVTSIGDSFDEDYPGDDEVFWAADDECYEAFEGYAGEYLEDSTCAYGLYGPDQDAWSAGDRDIGCAILPFGVGSLEGSARDS